MNTLSVANTSQELEIKILCKYLLDVTCGGNIWWIVDNINCNSLWEFSSTSCLPRAIIDPLARKAFVIASFRAISAFILSTGSRGLLLVSLTKGTSTALVMYLYWVIKIKLMWFDNMHCQIVQLRQLNESAVLHVQ